jgi:hypothetical protein
MGLFKSAVRYITRGKDGYDWFGFDKKGFDKNGYSKIGYD